MDIKESILKVLENNRGKSISGTKLANELSVTRSAIWKNIKQLQEEGYKITAVNNRGYCLLPENDIISPQSIKPYLKGQARDFIFDIRQSVTSTNTLAKEMASKGAKEGTVIIAREQTEGRGRMGRSFYSPANTGIYFSIILRPKLTIEDSLLITTSAAVAVADAIEEVSGSKTQIKWVNDIYVSDKKVCGILTEASLNFENGGLEYAVVGIGININTDIFPDDIKTIAGSVFESKPKDIPITSILLANIINNIASSMGSLTDKRYLDEYKRRSFLIGKPIVVFKGKDKLTAKAIDIDDKARLLVEYDDGSLEALQSGEVSVRAV
ncbi:MAG: biotin--[acetyl-CoA-carboxylase] ligase [Clostridiales bacterium]|nr:biotin--[acetyl-CoA-carboxylase] ligase [Clostridiales bacterium]